MIRDFSEEKKQELLLVIDKIDRVEWKSFYDFCGNEVYNLQSWIEGLEIQRHIQKVDEYQEQIQELNVRTRNQLNRVFENVNMIDRKYAKELRQYSNIIREQIKICNDLCRNIDIVTKKSKGMCVDYTIANEIERSRDFDEKEKIEYAENILRNYLIKQGYESSDVERIISKVKKADSGKLLSLYITNIYSTSDMNIILKQIENSYWPLQDIQTMSDDAKERLKDLEIANYQLQAVGVYENGELIGIKPYYVMINNQNGTHSDDGGITIGYGHHVSKEDLQDVNRSEYQLFKQYVPDEVIITGIVVDNKDLPQSGVIIVEDAEMVPIEVVDELFNKDIEEHSKKVAEFLEEEGIELTQGQFDALVIYRYNKGSLSDVAIEYLREGNMNEEDWYEVWSGGPNRADVCQELFFGGK